MKNRLFVLLAAALAMLSLGGCVGLPIVRGSGQVATQERAIIGVDAVALEDFGTLTIEIGDRESLIVEAEKNLLPYIVSEVEGGRLRIGVREGVWLRNTKPIRYRLTVRSLNEASVSGSGDIVAAELAAPSLSLSVSGSGGMDVGEVEADEVRLRISGSGTIRLDDLYARDVDARISGSGDLIVDRGEVTRQQVTVTGSGTYAAAQTVSEESDVRVSGSGTARVHASETLNARVSGSGTVRYAGRPSVQANTTGSGTVSSIGEE
jgi:hypothetical protein